MIIVVVVIVVIDSGCGKFGNDGSCCGGNGAADNNNAYKHTYRQHRHTGSHTHTYMRDMGKWEERAGLNFPVL